MSRGRPLRFLGWVLGGWVTLRLGMVLLPLLQPASEAGQPGALRAQPQRAAIAHGHGGPPMPAVPVVALAGHGTSAVPMPIPAMGKRGAVIAWKRSGDGSAASPSSPFLRGREPDAAFAPAREVASATSPSGAGSLAAPALTAWVAGRDSPWSLSAWMLWRPDGGASLAQAPLLGGSQGGVRLDYRLWRAGTRSLALYGRLTRALERPFAEEAALGLALRPVEGVPVTLHAERRQRLGAGGRSGFALFAAGGIGPQPVAAAVELEGYAQAGVVGLPGAAGFADGRMTLGYRLTPPARTADLVVGVAVSGSAQPGAARLDVGPELRLRLPVAGGHLRLSAEWRQRVAGSARPASGPALALVADF